MIYNPFRRKTLKTLNMWPIPPCDSVGRGAKFVQACTAVEQTHSNCQRHRSGRQLEKVHIFIFAWPLSLVTKHAGRGALLRATKKSNLFSDGHPNVHSCQDRTKSNGRRHQSHRLQSRKARLPKNCSVMRETLPMGRQHVQSGVVDLPLGRELATTLRHPTPPNRSVLFGDVKGLSGMVSPVPSAELPTSEAFPKSFLQTPTKKTQANTPNKHAHPPTHTSMPTYTHQHAHIHTPACPHTHTRPVIRGLIWGD